MSRRRLVLLALLALPLLLAACNGAQLPPPPMQDYRGYLKEPPTVRILLSRDANTVSLRLPGGWQAVDELTGARLTGRTEEATVRAAGGSLLVDGRAVNAQSLRFHAAADEPAGVNGRTYRGDVQVRRQRDGTLAVINLVAVDECLPGILAGEISSSWPMEAIQAQAVAARTYVLNRKKTERGNICDLIEGVHAEYRGAAGETARLRRAVNETRGVVMMHDNALFPAFFHAICGGYTEDAEFGFGPSPESDFVKGVPCGFCDNAPGMRWQARFPLDEVRAALRKKYANVGAIRALHFVTPEQRVRLVIVDTDSGRLHVPAAAFRGLLGADKLRSTWFEARLENGALVAEGRGWGHGVGLCQYGALGMARAGRGYGDILHHYFVDVELVRIY